MLTRKPLWPRAAFGAGAPRCGCGACSNIRLPRWQPAASADACTAALRPGARHWQRPSSAALEQRRRGARGAHAASQRPFAAGTPLASNAAFLTSGLQRCAGAGAARRCCALLRHGAAARAGGGGLQRVLRGRAARRHVGCFGVRLDCGLRTLRVPACCGRCFAAARKRGPRAPGALALRPGERGQRLARGGVTAGWLLSAPLATGVLLGRCRRGGACWWHARSRPQALQQGCRRGAAGTCWELGGCTHRRGCGRQLRRLRRGERCSHPKQQQC